MYQLNAKRGAGEVTRSDSDWLEYRLFGGLNWKEKQRLKAIEEDIEETEHRRDELWDEWSDLERRRGD